MILPATRDGAPHIARVHVDTWCSAYVGIVVEPTLRDMSYEASAKLQAAIRLAAAESLPPTLRTRNRWHAVSTSWQAQARHDTGKQPTRIAIEGQTLRESTYPWDTATLLKTLT